MTDAPTLTDRLTEARLTVATMEHETGKAALDGKPIDHTILSGARAEVEALERAELEALRRQAHADADLRAAERDVAAKAARDALEAYTAAVVRCESAAKAMATNLKAMETAAVTLRKSFLVMSRRLPVTLEASAIRTTLSRLLAGELTGIDRTCGFGQMKWMSVPTNPDWSEHIVKWIKPAVDAAIEKELAE